MCWCVVVVGVFACFCLFRRKQLTGILIILLFMCLPLCFSLSLSLSLACFFFITKLSNQVAFLIDAYQAHVASIALRVKKWEKETRRRLHSQSSMPDALRRSTSMSSVSSSRKSRASTVDENYRVVERKLSEEEAKWQRRLRAAACRLGYDISMYSVRREKGVSDFYQDLFKEN